MPVRSVVTIDVQDQKWRTFQDAFNKYDSALRKQPELWEKVSKEHEMMAKSFDKFASSQSRMVDSARQLASHWRDMGTTVARMGAGAVRTLSSMESAISGMLSKLGQITGVSAVLGLAGLGGSLYGLDRLAGTVGAGRRMSMGLGTDYGRMQAFGLTYSRLVNTGAVMGGVNTGTGDITSGAASALYSLGIDPTGGGDTGQTAEQVIRRAHQLVRGQPRGMVGSIGQAYGLHELGLSTEDLLRLRETSGSELGQFQKEFTGRSGMFHVTPAIQKAWQDFGNKLEEAGQKIETTFIRVLGKPEFLEALNKLSTAFSDFVSKIVSSGGVDWALTQLTKGLKWLGDYLTDGRAKKDWDDLMEKVVKLGETIGKFIDWVSSIFGWSSAGGGGTANLSEGQKNNYAGMMRSLTGGGQELIPYNTPEDAMRAHAKLLQGYQDQYGQDTIRKVIAGIPGKDGKLYHGYSATDQEGYIKFLSKELQMGPDAKLDFHNASQLSAFMSAQAKMENVAGRGRDPRYSPQAIKVVIENQTGGNAQATAVTMGYP
jgi:hypothetical protein